MELNEYIEQTFPIQCKGRNSKGLEVLQEPVNVEVKIYKSPGSNIISNIVRCFYNTGSHGERCKASHPTVDKVGEGIICPYSFDIPYALEKSRL